jgi:hypothetical protein
MEMIPQEFNAVAVYASPTGIKAILEDIKTKALSIVPDTSTAKGRKEIASVAYKVAQSKTLLDTKGKELVFEWKEKSKKVDEQRKLAREFLDNLRDDVRHPLTIWEKEEETRIAAEIAESKKMADWDLAIAENELFNRVREIERKEVELKKIEQERIEKEAAVEAARLAKEAEAAAIAEKERLAKEQAERDLLITQRAKEEAAREAQSQLELAKKRAEEELMAEKQASAQREVAAKAEAEKKLADERAMADRLAKEAELKRIADIKAAQDKAEAEKQAIIKAQIEKERIEKEKIALENKRLTDEKAADQKRQANIQHRKKINNEVLDCLANIGVSQEKAKDIIKAIVEGKIKNVSITY